ncbi:RagB/SusD family nutrient uptake outer membrane protein [Cyclobacterium jeungdonense]|uniref:RagB/SusD family nutrient uptake outer membrane protein n=1 Tax=Cyclobacterium jeungdonense TaxID=708087 RepID=A0ABT8C9A5_9BACT|nr:RagB/SusD family nutrient uptake outer membrane protein [Cyclobacterium jeungdonense]MDN3688246.1 RagB/SusD family nutrient uptake outer membrane protein [Cyclobacterium jeungdonense]
MKTIKIFLVLLIILLQTGCSDEFLNTEPLTEKTEPFFFKTQQDAYQALIGCYAGFLDYDNTSYSWWAEYTTAEILGDDGVAGSAIGINLEADAVDRFDINVNPSSLNIYKAHYNAAWVAINRINTLLSKLDLIDWTDMSGGENLTREMAEGEAKVLRAYIYFCMVRRHGNIPLITENTENPANEPQADPSLIYVQILQDLEDAANLLNKGGYSPETSTGRMSEWAAKALAARVYLFATGYYGKTGQEIPLGIGKGSVDKMGLISKINEVLSENEIKGYLTDIINNGGFSLIPNFQSLWITGSVEAQRLDPNFPGYVGENNPEVIMSMKTTYLNGNHNGFSKWIGPRQVNSDIVYGTGWGIGLPLAKGWDLFDPNDTRRSASLLNLLLERGEEGYNLWSTKDQRSFTGFYYKKYIPLNAEPGLQDGTRRGGGGWPNSWYQDYILIRYADVLLMAAEMGIDAQANLDAVRVRAYGQSYVDANPLTPTYENIMHERHLEFFGEGIRYFDVLRQGVEEAAQILTIPAPGIVVKDGPNIYGSTNIIVDGENVQKTSGLQQIPWDEINLSDGLLIQNVGWER